MTADLREEARSIAERRPDAIITWPVSQRRAFLYELAEHVENETRWAHKPFTQAVPSIVPNVAAALCPDPVAVFNELVDAIHERQQAVSKGDDRLAEIFDADVTWALDRLLGAHS